MLRLILLISIISFSNFWIYQIFDVSFLLGLILLIETTLLYYTTQTSSKLINVFILTTTLCLSAYLLINNFDKNIFSNGIVDSIQIRERQNYYFNELGRIYNNKFAIFYFSSIEPIINKTFSNLFYALDFNTYFASHRLIDQEKYTPLLIILFVYGLLKSLQAKHKVLIPYLLITLITTSLINLNNAFGLIMFFPFINYCLIIGLENVLKLRRFFRII